MNEVNETGWMEQLVGRVRRWAGGDKASASAAEAGSPGENSQANEGPAWMREHAAKLLTAAEAAALVRHGDHVFIGTACATPRTLVRALENLPYRQSDVEFVHFLTDGALPHNAQGECTSGYRHRSFFVGNDVRAAVRQGLAEYVPLSAARVPQLMANGRIKVDVALIQVAPPDAFGYVSLGVSVDVIPAAVARARLVIAEVNPAMPRSMGESMLHLSEIDHLVPVDTPVIEYHHPEVAGEVADAIARYIGGIIDDGSTLQIGLGRFSNQALRLLEDRKDLGVHSDLITDAIIPLLEKGMLTGQRKTRQRGKIVASFAMGTRRLYDLIDGNPLFEFQPLDAICDPGRLAAQHKLVSVTQAFAVDLSGQVCVDQLDGAFYSGLAAQAEFLQGASRSAGGKAIICLASTSADGQRSQVRTTLDAGEGASIARSDVHYVITEYGIAYLFGKSIRERAAALIELAHPKFRAELLAQAKALGWLPADQMLKHMQAYAVQDERQLQLKDQRAVLLRPAVSTDDVAVRELFHQLPDADIYTRFFRKIKGMSNRDIQRLCNLNHETEAAFVAAVGARENPQVVAHACYFVDASTNIAETAFMVHPQWQGNGLGAALQARMLEHARARGVLGFVAEILATNEKMIKLARTGADSGKVSMTQDGGTVRITVLF